MRGPKGRTHGFTRVLRRWRLRENLQKKENTRRRRKGGKEQRKRSNKEKSRKKERELKGETDRPSAVRRLIYLAKTKGEKEGARGKKKNPFATQRTGRHLWQRSKWKATKFEG